MKKMMQFMGSLTLAATVGLLTLTATSGCGTLTPEQKAGLVARLDEAIAVYGEWQESQNQAEAPPPVAVVTNTIPNGDGTLTNAPPEGGTPNGGAADFNGLKFRNSQDCRAWPVTVTVSDVGFRGGNITWRESGHRSEWNRKTGKNGKTVDGEIILLIPSIGQAGMFDFKGVGQREKILSNLKPSHEGPGFFPGWVPKKGERVGFCIATISRDPGAAKMKERSNVVWFEWPRDGI